MAPARTALSPSGPMSRLQAKSIEDYARGATQLLTWALTQGVQPGTPHRHIWSSPRIQEYVASAKARGLRPTTIRTQLFGIDRVLYATAPEVNRRHILDEINALPPEGDRELRRERIQEKRALVDCGIAYAESALATAGVTSDIAYSTGLQITLLADRPYRLQMFTTIEWWESDPPPGHPHLYLIKILGRWWICYRGPAGSKKPYHNLRVPDRVVPWLEQYLFGGARDRLFARTGYDGRRLWASSRDGALTPNGLYKRIVKATERAFGAAVNPHLFRVCWATSWVRNNPDKEPSAHLVLGNSPAVTARHYDHSSRTLEGARELNARLEMLFPPSQTRTDSEV